MDTLITILKGAGIIAGFTVIILPIAIGLILEAPSAKTKLGKFYWETWPMILLGGLGMAVLILAFYVIGKEF